MGYLPVRAQGRVSTLCGSRKYPYSPHGGSLEIPGWGGEGVFKAKLFIGKYEAKLEFPEGWSGGVQTKKPFHGGVSIFSVIIVAFYPIVILVNLAWLH